MAMSEFEVKLLRVLGEIRDELSSIGADFQLWQSGEVPFVVKIQDETSATPPTRSRKSSR